MKIKDSSITINVKDLDKSISFYLSIGFSLKNRYGNFFPEITAPGLTIGLHPTDGVNMKNNSGNVSVGFTSENFEETKSFLNELSIEITERQEEGGQFLHFNDPDGTAIYFINPKWK